MKSTGKQIFMCFVLLALLFSLGHDFIEHRDLGNIPVSQSQQAPEQLISLSEDWPMEEDHAFPLPQPVTTCSEVLSGAYPTISGRFLIAPVSPVWLPPELC